MNECVYTVHVNAHTHTYVCMNVCIVHVSMCDCVYLSMLPGCYSYIYVMLF